MSRRVEIDESRAPERIHGALLNELFAHARETLPEECCGLILGDDQRRFERVIRCRNEATHRHQANPELYPRDGRQAFFMNEFDYMQAQNAAEAEGKRITAVYHSHVDAGAYLSALDLDYAESEFFPFPEADHVVLSVRVQDRVVDQVGVFRREGEEGAFTGRRLTAEAGSA